MLENLSKLTRTSHPRTSHLELSLSSWRRKSFARKRISILLCRTHFLKRHTSLYRLPNLFHLNKQLKMSAIEKKTKSSAAASKPLDTIVLKDPSDLSRAELQAALKALKLPATGSTDNLRQRYGNARDASVPEPPGLTKPSSGSKDPAGKPEKRLKRFRKSPPQGVQQRIERALSQSLYLVTKSDVNSQDLSCKFVVLGSTGNVYDVVTGRMPTCSCPDHAKGNLCKHILFVLLKVMAIPPASPLVYQQAWIGTELEEMYSFMANRFQQVSGGVMANSAVRNEYAKLQQCQHPVSSVVRRKDLEDCPICFDALEASADITYCRSRCGASFHGRCIVHWLGQQGRNPTCPMCRGPWEGAEKKVSSDGDFKNLGRLQGQSPHRDMSSYSSWYRYHHSP